MEPAPAPAVRATRLAWVASAAAACVVLIALGVGVWLGARPKPVADNWVARATNTRTTGVEGSPATPAAVAPPATTPAPTADAPREPAAPREPVVRAAADPPPDGASPPAEDTAGESAEEPTVPPAGPATVTDTPPASPPAGDGTEPPLPAVAASAQAPGSDPAGPATTPDPPLAAEPPPLAEEDSGSPPPAGGSAPAVPDPLEPGEAADLDLAGQGAGQDAAFDDAPAATTRPATGPARAKRPPLQPRPAPREMLTDRQIERSIRRGGNFIIRQFTTKTMTLRTGRTPLMDARNPVMEDPAGYCGQNALCVYALMQVGLALNEPELGPRGKLMGRMIDSMKRLDAGRGKLQTYARGVRATALALFNRPEDQYTLHEDVGCLLHGHDNGKYGYQSAKPVGRGTTGPARFNFPGLVERGWWDNSNSQYGLLGVWSGAEAGIEIPESYWDECEQHWTETQSDRHNTWGYKGAGRGGSQSMTAAGLASLFVISDYKSAARDPKEVGGESFSPALIRGMRWFQSGDNAVRIRSGWWGYTLYGIERVGLASGFKYFGKNDWYRVLARQVIARQNPDGGWGGSSFSPGSDRVDSAFALLFLARARHPVVMNKLGFDGAWANRPRDVANLARYATRQLERPLIWQVVPAQREWHDWTDSPILYVASHQAIKFTDRDCDNLRQFAHAGGLIFTHTDGGADGDGEAFNLFVEKALVKRLWPRYELRDLSPDHAVYTVAHKIKQPVPLRGVSNGSRLLLVHSPTDVAWAWQARDDTVKTEHLFQIGLNLFVYAGGKRDLRNRLDPTYIPEPPKGKNEPPLGTLNVARVQYAGGDWDPEPYAWERFARLFQWRTGYGLDVRPVRWKELTPQSAPVAHLTGRAKYDPTDDEIAALRSYAEGGGVLFVDDCGGSGAFAGSMRAALGKAFPEQKLAPLPWDHPLLNVGEPGMKNLSKPKVRSFTQDTVGAAPAKVAFETLRAGKGAVVFSKLDVVSGLLGTQTWGINGYDRRYCEDLMQNLVFWAIDGQPGNEGMTNDE